MPDPSDPNERTLPSGEQSSLSAARTTLPETAARNDEADRVRAEGTLMQDDLSRRSSSVISLRSGEKPTITGYELHERLGEGSYGVVYRAVEEQTGRTVAIKFYHSKMGGMWQIVWAEVRQLALLDAVHGIVQLKTAEPAAEPPYFVMNYAEGGSLASRIRKGPLPLAEALPLFEQMVEALAYVHAKGIRHCDLKPANILLDALGKPLLADFGQAHLSLGSEAVSGNLGTFFYMAPDQADLQKQIPDTRWDVYSLGAIFYCMLTGKPPRASATLTDELSRTAHVNSRLSRYREGIAAAPAPVEHRKLPGMDRPLAAILEKCLRLDPQRRYQSASEIRQALAQRERYRRRRPVLLLGMAATLLLVVGVGGFAWSMLHASVAEAKDSLVRELVPSDRTAVNMIANVVADKLDALMDTVQNVAKKEELIDKAGAFFDQLDPKTIADKSYRKTAAAMAAQKSLDNTYRPGFRHWIVYDTQGRMLLASYVLHRNPTPAEVAQRSKVHERYEGLLGTSFAYRDYFHGRGGDRKGEPLPYEPRLRVSEPYESTLVVDGRKPVMIGISTPLYQLKDGEPDKSAAPFGVLIGFIDVEKDLASWLRGVQFTQGSAALLNHHGQCVYHSGEKDLFERKDGRLRTRTDLQALVAASVAGEQFDLGPRKDLCLPSHAYLPAGSAKREWEPTEWVALIVHDQDQVFGQVERLRDRLSLIILFGGGALLVVLAGLWLWLLRSLRGQT
ncbi:MAG: serine/threonine-protein kinase [Gemmataceae bacterium]